MAWRSRSSPCFHPGHVHQRRPGETFVRCSATLANKLAVNGLLPDEATGRQGNCGLDDVANILLAQLKDGRAGAGHRETAKHKLNLKTTLDKVALLRRVGVAWLEANGS